MTPGKNPASLAQLAWYFFRLGYSGFGGPVALANAMRRDLVDRFDWIGAAEYDEGLAIATACPGPLAYQLAAYCGYLLHGFAGAACVAVAFAAAPFAIVCAVAALYVTYGSNRWLTGLFFGVGPVVIAIVARSCWDLGVKTLRGQWLAMAFAAVACAITIVVQQELVALFLVAGAIGIFAFAPRKAASPQHPQPPVAPPGTPQGLSAIATLATVPLPELFWFFFKTGFLIFGSGLVIVPFLKAYVVDQYHWLSNRAFLDAVAVGIISPGPVVITATFVGYLTHGLAGAFAATAGMFAPSLIFVFAGTPILRRYRHLPAVQGFIRGITIAVVGVLVGTSYLLARGTIRDWRALTILAVALAALWPAWRRRIPEQLLIAAGAVVGIAFAAVH